MLVEFDIRRGNGQIRRRANDQARRNTVARTVGIDRTNDASVASTLNHLSIAPDNERSGSHEPRPIDIRDYETALDDAGAADLWDCLIDVAAVPGDVVECGSWRGGSAMFMADVVRHVGMRKRIYACDSFEGFALDELRAERAAGWTAEPDDAFASTSLKYVEAKISARGLDGAVVPVRGYFADTLPTLTGAFSLVVIDCDLSRSALFAAETLWPRVAQDGSMLFDDYSNEAAFRGIKRAVDTFVASHSNEIGEHGLLRRLYRVSRTLAT